MRAVPTSMRWSLKKAVDAYVWNQVAKFRLNSMLTDHAVEGDLILGGYMWWGEKKIFGHFLYPNSPVNLCN